AAVARGDVDVAHRLAEDVREGAQYLVAGLVAEAVVDLLEVVQVGQDEREGAAEALGAADLARERVLELTAVGKLGEAVGTRLARDEAVKANVLESDRGLG